MPYSISHKLALQNTKSIATLLTQILEFIDNHLSYHAAKEGIVSKSQFIVNELLTNAIKHTGDAETTIHIFIDDKNITIKKEDSGNRFNPHYHPFLLDNPAGYKGRLSQDPIHTVYAVIEGRNVLKFVCEENSYENSTDIDELTEHFGLLIITKYATEFTYQYDPSSGVNTFIARIALL